MYMSADGNFKLQLKRKDRNGTDVNLLSAFFLSEDELDQFLAKSSPVKEVGFDLAV